MSQATVAITSPSSWHVAATCEHASFVPPSTRL
jgi:hypothetical protein